jgi:CDP-diacylglycerol--glycerol-3-phosphate 3-phosphatidyltransferase
MKLLPNIITIARMALLLALPFFLQDRTACIILLSVCGLGDLLDGIVARALNAASKLGARLDSIADLLLFCALILCVIVWAGERLYLFLPYIGIIAAVRCINIAIAFSKYHAFAILHTWGNKIAGLSVFVFAGLFMLTDEPVLFWPAIILCILSALEETAIHIFSKRLDLNRRSIFY